MKKLLRSFWQLFKRSIMFRIATYCAIIGLALLVLGGCVMWMPGRSYRGPLDPLSEKQAALRDALKRDLTRLAADIGDRNTFSLEKLNEAADWIESSLKNMGYTVTRQSYEADKTTFYNITAEIDGGEKADEIIVVGAHYDSIPGCPAANDNGTGVAALLALARAFAKKEPSRTLRFVAFANEEPPYFQSEHMGSRVYAKACREKDEKIVGMISLETIGYYSEKKGSQRYPFPLNLFYPSTGNFIAFVGNMGSGKLVRNCIGAFRRHAKFPSEGAALPSIVPAAGLSDHWAFWQEGYPALMVTDTAFFRYEHYHTNDDTVDKITFDHFARVVDGLEAVVDTLANDP